MIRKEDSHIPFGNTFQKISYTIFYCFHAFNEINQLNVTS